MATTINAGSLFLAAATPRLLTQPNSAILVSATAPLFHVNTSGTPDTTSIIITAQLISLSGTVTFSITGGTLSSVSGNTAVLTYANMSSTLATITATLVYRGTTFTSTTNISKVFDGATGATGLNNAIAYAYKRSASAPVDNPGAITYDFTTASISTATLANSWVKTIPTGTDPLYVTTAPASNIASTDSIASTEWSGAVKLAQDGVNGLSVATVFIYQRTSTSTAPTLPSVSTTYTFATGVLTGLNNGWSTSVPTSSGSTYLWVSTASAANTTTTDTILSSEWAATQIMTQDGSTGSRGAGTYYATGSAWDDTVANIATPGSNVTDDLVTISNGSTYALTKRWDGAAWVSIGTVIDGNLLVTGSVGAAKINANGLSIRKADGTLILDASGSGLQTGFEAPGTKNSDISLGVNLIPANSLPSSTTGFTAFSSSNAYSWQGPLYASPADGPGGYQQYSPGSAGCVWVAAGGTPAAGTYIDIYKDAANAYPVVALRRYEFGVSISAHRCDARIIATWYTAAGGYLGDSLGTVISASQATFATIDFPRSVIFATAPTGAEIVTLRTRENHTGLAGPFTFASQWYMGEAGATQTVPTKWAEAPMGVSTRISSAATTAAWTGVSGTGKPADNATVGAPSGTNVGSTSATTVESNAANGASAYTAVNDSTTGLAQRMRANADNVLGGIISANAVSAPAGFRAGTLTWDASGTRTGGYGVAITPKGLVGYTSAGVQTFAIDATTGAATFGGALSAVSITSGGSVSSGQTAYNTGTGFWFGPVSGTPKFSIGVASGVGLTWDGTSLTIKDATTVKSTPFAVNSISDPSYTLPKGTSYQLLGTYTASSTGGTGTIHYAFTLDQGYSPGAGMSSYISISGASVSVYGKCNLVATCDINVTVTAVDSSGAAAAPEGIFINVSWT